MSIHKSTFIWGCIFGITAIVLGAFAAHGLEPRLSAHSIGSFQVAVRYQMYHALFLLVLSLLRTKFPSQKLSTVIASLAITGTLLFSGSIYLLSTRDIHGLKVGFLGPVTPFGGTLLIISWAMLLVQGAKIKGSSSKV